MKDILVIDDEEYIRNTLFQLLSHEGYNVRSAENGERAFSILDNNNNIDIILLDLKMPGMNGKDVLLQIKKQYSSIEVIIVSGEGSIGDVVSLVKEGAYDYIEKPFDNDVLLSKILRALRQRELNLKFKYFNEQYSNIKKLKEYNESIFNNMHTGILTVDNEDMLNIHNSSAEKILKTEFRNIRNKNIFSILKEILNDYNKIESYYKRLKDHNEKFDLLFLNNIMTGEKKKYHFRVSGSRFSEGIVLFITDITEEYNLKQQLLHSERMSTIGQFISSITHGLGNNMANIIANTCGIVDEVDELTNNSTLLVKKIGLDKKNKITKEVNSNITKNQKRIKDYSNRLLKRTNEMSNNIKSLLNYSRNRHEQIKKTPANINTLIEDAINIVKSQKYENIKFTCSLEKNMPLINVNSYQIRDMFIDLILNGIQAMNGKGRLKFKTRFIEEKKSIQITISDTGCGISKEIKDEIFSAFFSTKKNGTGLGLINVQTTVKNHNGNISFETKNAKGTTFYVELPVK